MKKEIALATIVFLCSCNERYFGEKSVNSRFYFVQKSSYKELVIRDSDILMYSHEALLRMDLIEKNRNYLIADDSIQIIFENRVPSVVKIGNEGYVLRPISELIMGSDVGTAEKVERFRFRSLVHELKIDFIDSAQSTDIIIKDRSSEGD